MRHEGERRPDRRWPPLARGRETRTRVGRPRGERVSSAEPGGHGAGLASFVRQGTGQVWARGRPRQSARVVLVPQLAMGPGRAAFGDIVGAARVKLDISFFKNYTIQHVLTLILTNRCKTYPRKHLRMSETVDLEILDGLHLGVLDA